jgi:hypothetical protein
VKDEQEMRSRLRAKLQEHPELGKTSLMVGEGVGHQCFGCDEPITARQSSSATGYRCPAGPIHWFDDSCEAILDALRRPTGMDLIEEQRRRQDG